MTRRRTCRKHGVPLVEVFYGYPDGPDMERAARGEIVLGGDNILPGYPHPEYDCPKCDADAQNGEEGEPNACPTCGTALVPTVFGFPNEEITAEDRAGRIVHVGCCPVDASEACPKCRTWPVKP